MSIRVVVAGCSTSAEAHPTPLGHRKFEDRLVRARSFGKVSPREVVSDGLMPVLALNPLNRVQSWQLARERNYRDPFSRNLLVNWEEVRSFFGASRDSGP